MTAALGRVSSEPGNVAIWEISAEIEPIAAFGYRR